MTATTTAAVEPPTVQPFVVRRPGHDGPVVAEGAVFSDGTAVLYTRPEVSGGITGSIDRFDRPEDLLLGVKRWDASAFVLSVPDGLEMALDPWHVEAFRGTPAEGVIGATGARRARWLELDAWGQAIGTGPFVLEEA